MEIIFDLSHPIVWLVRHVYSDKAKNFLFCKRRPLSDALSNQTDVSSIYSLSQSLQGIEEIVSVHCSFVAESLG